MRLLHAVDTCHFELRAILPDFCVLFLQECRGFTQCGTDCAPFFCLWDVLLPICAMRSGMAAMNVMIGRAEAAAGNITDGLLNVVTPNGMYGEMVSCFPPAMCSGI